jgi:membrane-anchored protein YejM (alkaline phosphatase superfamily)
MSAYELAFRMQAAVPELSDLSKESPATRTLYGIDQEATRDFGGRCLMARRLVERGVRFVQLWSGTTGGGGDWDGHAGCDKNHQRMAGKVDKPIAGLLSDLKSRGLLDSTLVVWGGEFGRTPTSDGSANGGGDSEGRDHNPYGFTVWVAGGGVKGGKVIGTTDEIGLRVTSEPVHVHDLHATMLRFLGLDHEKLVYSFQGRDFRLTDVHGSTELYGKLTRA